MSDAQTVDAPAGEKPEPALKLKFLSHGTLECRDIDFTRKFYEEFLGFDVVKTSPISLLFRLGGNHTYATVKAGNKLSEMPLLYHNGIDVPTEAEVDAAHKITVEQADKWKITKISKPITQHGTYSFYFWDVDDNCWEICSNPEGGYSWLFADGDKEGKGHMSKEFDRPDSVKG